jgi:intracellular multiplication protein IcmD
MVSKQVKKAILLLTGAILCLCVGTVFAAAQSGIALIAANVTTNLSNIAKLITAGAYVAGFGFAVAAIVKFKAHKDNPTQIALSIPIVYLFMGAALMFAPAVFKSTGITLFGSTSGTGSISGTTTFKTGA